MNEHHQICNSDYICGLKAIIMKRDIPLTPHSFIKETKCLEYIEDKLYIGNISAEMNLVNYPFRTDWYICCICSAGESRGRINLVPYSLKGLEISINIPGQLLEHECMTHDFQGIFILMSKDFISGLGLPYNFQTYMSLQEAPILSLTENQYNSMLSYCNMVRKVIKIDHPNKLDIVKHLTCAFFYGMGYYFHQVAENKKLSNEEALMQRFQKIVQQYYKNERKVVFYAEKLHLSGGYLSTIIKNISGKTAAEWIDDYVTLEAKSLLKSTNLTIQQISDSLHFPSQSFFGKYFKRQTGMSPKKYRES